jgi:two-component system, chemotaxis family, protein-glutamate methylesterase/glutaminase
VPLRVLVVDDTIVFRRVVSEALAALPGVEVVGSAANGRSALQRLRDLEPDLVTLDIEMPEMDGIKVLEAMKEMGATAGVIVVSAVTRKGGQMTMKALERGAFDFITKPSETTIDANRDAIRQALAPRIAAFSRRREIRGILGQARTSLPAAPALPPSLPPLPPPLPTRTSAASTGGAASVSPSAAPPLSLMAGVGIVTIGVSTGGPVALGQIIPSLPQDLGVPVVVVQHMPPLFTQSLAESLDAKSAVRVREARHLEPLQPNVVYIAPGGKQMRVSAAGDLGMVLQITDDPPENNCRPAVDYLFRSVAEHYPNKALAVVLTGMGSDGTLGLRLLKRRGALTIAQDEASCVVYGMPKSAVEAGVVDQVVPLDAVATKIAGVVRGRRS